MSQQDRNFKLADALAANHGDRRKAAHYCRSMATSFPELRTEYSRYADLLAEKGKR